MYYLEKTRGIKYFKKFDYILFVCVLALSIFGLVVLQSATRTMPGSSRIMLVQAVSIALGAALALAISVIDYQILKPSGIFLYTVSTLLLVIVLWRGTGREELGSNSWLILPGGLSFQPSEFAKITFIIMVAGCLERMREGRGNRNILRLAAVAAVPVALVLLQPDYGTAMVFVVILAAMLFIWGISYKYMLIMAGVSVLAATAMWMFFLNVERKERIIEFLFPGSDPSGASYQVMKAKMAIGSGRIMGSGLGHGIQSQNTTGGIPIKESDCIFAVIGEELGFLGTAFVVILVVIILLRCLSTAAKSRDLFGEYVVIGVTGMLAFHFFENIGMNLGVLPVTGIPLPFVSAGGSAMITNYFALGIVLSVAVRKRTAMFGTDH